MIEKKSLKSTCVDKILNFKFPSEKNLTCSSWHHQSLGKMTCSLLNCQYDIALQSQSCNYPLEVSQLAPENCAIPTGKQ